MATWHDKKSPKEKAEERAHELEVSRRICAMSVLWVNVPDLPGPTSDRAVIERNAIALLSNKLNPLDPPSNEWLGRASVDPRIVRSGLWNLNHVEEGYDSGFLGVLDRYIDETLAK